MNKTIKFLLLSVLVGLIILVIIGGWNGRRFGNLAYVKSDTAMVCCVILICLVWAIYKMFWYADKFRGKSR